MERRPPVRALAVDDGGSGVHGVVDGGRGQCDRAQRAGARTRLDSGPPPDPATRSDSVDPIRRQVDLSRRHVQGRATLQKQLSFNVSYTLSTSKDDASSPGATEAETNVPQNVRNIFDKTGEWAPSSFDHRHLFVASGTYQLPSFPGGGSHRCLLGDWRVSAIFSAQSGAPFTVNLGVDQANIGAGPSQRPDQLRDPNLPAGQRAPERWFDTAAFALQEPFTFGNAPRNGVIGPRYANLDLVLAKTWKRQRVTSTGAAVGSIQRAQHSELRSAQPNIRTPNFGRIFSAKHPREMQFGRETEFLSGILGLWNYSIRNIV